MTTDIKICGVSTTEALAAAIENDAAYAGFVFFDKSPRDLNMTQAATLAQKADKRIKTVGVFVNATDELVDQAMLAANLDVIQLHGKETPDRAAELAKRYKTEIWKALSVETSADLEVAPAYYEKVDRILFDAKTPSGSDLPGGMGIKFDWNLLDLVNKEYPWGLSGGLSPENIQNAINAAQPPLVDVSSGVESAPGVKDVDKILRFCQAVEQL